MVRFFPHNLEVVGSTCGNKLDAYGGKVVYIYSSLDPVKALTSCTQLSYQSLYLKARRLIFVTFICRYETERELLEHFGIHAYIIQSVF